MTGTTRELNRTGTERNDSECQDSRAGPAAAFPAGDGNSSAPRIAARVLQPRGSRLSADPGGPPARGGWARDPSRSRSALWPRKRGKTRPARSRAARRSPGTGRGVRVNCIHPSHSRHRGPDALASATPFSPTLFARSMHQGGRGLGGAAGGSIDGPRARAPAHRRRRAAGALAARERVGRAKALGPPPPSQPNYPPCRCLPPPMPKWAGTPARRCCIIVAAGVLARPLRMPARPRRREPTSQPEVH